MLSCVIDGAENGMLQQMIFLELFFMQIWKTKFR
jgi:hypothetical protein